MSTGTSTGTAKLKRRTSLNCLPTKCVVQGRRQRQKAVLPCQEPRAFDKSHAGRSLRYVSFVLGLGATVSAALFTPPVLFMARFGACERGCQSLAKDLGRSISHKVHPCDDFYEHVCSGWDSTKGQSPLSNYQAAFSRSIVKDMMLKKIPSRSTTAWGKAAGFIYRCLSRVEIPDFSSVTSFLHELGLPWPEKSPTNRQQLLDIFVKASLEFGMPMFVAFYVGRHPAQPFVNTIYITLEGRFSDWIADMEALAERGKADDYLRRCAETVGREGQSYSSMIRQVLQTHFEVVDLERLLWDDAAVPRFYNLSDPELRRAVNGHLPDESQLWPEDEIVILQPEFIVKLDEEQLSHSGYQESFKLFLGAYVVWALSPLVSRRLSTRLLVDVGGRSSEASNRLFKCMQALEMLMPLVKEQLHRDAQKDLWPTWTVVRLSARSMVSFYDTYGGLPKAFAYAVLSRLCVNAFNMTNTWHLLDNALAYFPNNTDEPFFDLYRRAAKATVTFFKQSLRRPQHNIHHVPGIVDFDVYRLLVNREVSIFHYLTSSPLYEPWYPAAVISALAATAVSAQMTALLRMAIYYDRNFQRVRFEDGTPETMRLALDVQRFRIVLKASGIFHGASRQDHSALYRESIAVHAASRVPEMPEWRRSAADGVHNPSMDEDVRNPFRKFQPEQLFFYLACFAHCGKRGRQRQKSVAICNVALPASPRFRRAFKCLPQNLLITNFTWPDPPMVFDDDSFE